MSFVECKAGRFESLFQNECHQFFGIPYAKYGQRWEESFPIEEEIHLLNSLFSLHPIQHPQAISLLTVE